MKQVSLFKDETVQAALKNACFIINEDIAMKDMTVLELGFRGQGHIVCMIVSLWTHH